LFDFLAADFATISPILDGFQNYGLFCPVRFLENGNETDSGFPHVPSLGPLYLIIAWGRRAVDMKIISFDLFNMDKKIGDKRLK